MSIDGRVLGMMLRRLVVPVLLSLMLTSMTPMSAPVVAAATSCEALASLALPNTTITSAQTVAAGAFTPPPAAARPGGGGPREGAPGAPANPANAPVQGGRPGGDGRQGRGGGGPGRGAVYTELPAFCRVSATLAPTSDSDIKVEVWLPASGWNGKYQAVGNGGWAGTISYPAMAQALLRGYATSSTDTGHVGGSGSFALGHPEKLIDYAYRSEHEMTVKAKAIIEGFYGSAPKYSYWNGCSTGGKQGLTEAQRYPNDFDGIIAGAPANYMIHLHVWSVWINQAVHKSEASYIPPAKYPVLHDAVMTACDALDGVKDGLLEDPTTCRFDPKVVQCPPPREALRRDLDEAQQAKSGQGADGPTCLTAAQVDAARKIYAPLVNPRTKKEIFPSMVPGSELAWGALAGPQAVSVATDTFKYVIFKDPNWDYRTLNLDRDVALADKVDAGLNNAINSNLEPFFGRGGKLLMYHGWNDQLIAPGNSVNYYNSVVKEVGGAAKAGDSIRLFMAPGMTHCNGGAGPNTFDSVTALEQWVEQKKAPDQLIASHSTDGKIDRTRPLCSYPRVAKYKGSGSIDEATNFVCVTVAQLSKPPVDIKKLPRVTIP